MVPSKVPAAKPAPARAPRSVLALGLVLAGAVAPAGAGFRIAPGPAGISEEERAIVPDAARGAQHGVVLLEEWDRDDSDIVYPTVAHHLRAKILSNEGRDLANIVIPFNRKTGYLRKWWARTIRPDGSVVELRREELAEQTVLKGNGVEVRVLKAALPGVVPGSVIDYGWAYRGDSIRHLERVPLQRPWRIRELRYRWAPTDVAGSSYRLVRVEGLDVTVSRERRAIFVRGLDLPPAPLEPHGPPADVVTSALILYYRAFGVRMDDFWDHEMRRAEARARAFYEERGGMDLVRREIAAMNLTPGATLGEKLREVYEKLGARLRSAPLLTSEETEAEEERRESESRRYEVKFVSGIERVLAAGVASEPAYDATFLAFARALGAEAHLVHAADRTDHYFDPGLFTMEQFDATVVAVRDPGEPGTEAALVDAGSGLPYGEIPWWLTPTAGLLATEAGAREIVLPASEAGRSVSATRATLHLDPSDGSASVLWQRRESGQHGLSAWRLLRRQTPAERKRTLEAWCGHGERLDVSRADGPRPEDSPLPLRYACEGRLGETGLDVARSPLRLRYDGPWIEPVPLIPAGPRLHPVVLEFPRVDLATIDVVLPEGWAAAIPPPIRLDTPFGRYTLAVSPTPTGCSVRRDVALLRAMIPRDEYEEARAFFEAIRLADRSPLVLSRGGPPAGEGPEAGRSDTRGPR